MKYDEKYTNGEKNGKTALYGGTAGSVSYTHLDVYKRQVLGALLILTVNPMQAVIFVILFQVLQQIEGNFIYPHVMGTSIGLPPLWVLFAVTVGGAAMGIFGMLLFIPACSVFHALMKEAIQRRLREKDIPKEKWENPSS